MDADHQKSAFASKRDVPKCPFGELYVLHFQTDDFLRQNFAENRKRLLVAIGTYEKSVKEMMEAVGLKNRPNFLEYSLTPAITEGLVKMKYPNSPRHPRQKYLLTVKGLAVYDECVKSM